MNNAEAIRQSFVNKTREQKDAFLASLSEEELMFIYATPRIFLFDKQIIPDGDWRYCLLMCGRRFGKSVSGATWTSEKIIGGAKSVGLCGEDYGTVRDVMVKNIITMFPPGEAIYNDQKHVITFNRLYKGAHIYCYTSDKEIKGPSLEYAWCDELGNWCDRNPEKVQIRFDSFDTAVSVGKHPQTIITTTPRSFPYFIDFQDKIDNGNTNYIMMTGNMFDNPFLSEGYKQKELEKYKDKPILLRQEFYGEIINENPGALFQREWIEKNRIYDPKNTKKDNKEDLKYFFKMLVPQEGKREPELYIKRCVISADPSGSSKISSDETGIIVLLQDMKNEVYVIHDRSGVYTPDAWARIVKDLFWHYKKIFPFTNIVVETNFGGDLVIANLLAADHNLRPFIKEIKASKSKTIRAEAPAAKYQRDKIHHVGFFDKLERQMCNYTGTKDVNAVGAKSPDRMDALVHGINELVILPQAIGKAPAFMENY